MRFMCGMGHEVEILNFYSHLSFILWCESQCWVFSWVSEIIWSSHPTFQCRSFISEKLKHKSVLSLDTHPCHPFTHSLTRSSIHSLIHSLTHPFAHSLIHKHFLSVCSRPGAKGAAEQNKPWLHFNRAHPLVIMRQKYKVTTPQDRKIGQQEGRRCP